MAIPRVTTILKRYNDYGNVPPLILEKAAARGSAVHALCEGIAKGEWITESMVEPKWSGYVQSFREWHESQVESYAVIEKRLFDRDLNFSGQVDLVINSSQGMTYLCDLKTTAKSHKTHAIQLAAYEHLLAIHGIEVEASMIVYLQKNGSFPEIQLYEDLTNEWNVFLSALHCYNYFNHEDDDGTETDECVPKDTSNNEGAGLHPEG